MQITDSEEMLRNSVRRFVEAEMSLTSMQAWARSGDFPESVYQQWAEQGWLGVGLSEELGGSAAGAVQIVTLGEELSRHGFDITGAYSTAVFLSMTLARHGSPMQQQRFLPALLKGNLHLSTAISEPDTGSDISALGCAAKHSGAGWSISGEKFYCSGAHLPGTMILVTCRTETVAGSPKQGLTMLLVPNDSPGLTIRRMDTMGRKIFGTNELHFDNVRVPDDMVLGQVGGAWDILRAGLDLERLFIAGGYVGNAQSALDLAVRFAQDRIQFGKPISRYQAVSHKLVDLRLRVDAARLLTYRAANLLEQGRPCRAESSMAKLAASEALVQVTNDGMQILGGYGYTTETPMERWFRDARVTTIMGGTSEMQRNIIAHEMRL